MTRIRSLLLLSGLACAWIVLLAAPGRADDCARLIRSHGKAAVLKDPGVIQDCLRTGQNWGWIIGAIVGGTATGIALVGLPGESQGTEGEDCAILAARYRAARQEYLTKVGGPDAELDRIVADVKSLDEAHESGVKDWQNLEAQIDGLAQESLVLGGEILTGEAIGALFVKGAQVGLLATPQARAVMAEVQTAWTLLRGASAAEAAAGGAAGGSALGPIGALAGAAAGFLALVVAEIALEKVENMIVDHFAAEKLKELNARHAALLQAIKEAAVRRDNGKAGLEALVRSRRQKLADYETRYTASEKEATDLHAKARQAVQAYFDAQCGAPQDMSDLPEHQPRKKEDLSYKPTSSVGQFMKWIGAISYD